MKKSPIIPGFVVALMVLVMAPPSGLAQANSAPPDLMSLVESERAFARTSVEKGVRASFLEYFAANCISFAPDAGNARTRLLARPAPNPLPATVLDWHPIYADISQGGDMGYTTGPSTFVDHRPTPRPNYYGFYFSVWKKQTDGSWKVVLDIGTETPDASAVPAQAFQPAPTIQLKLKSNYNAADGWAELVKLESEFAKLSLSKGIKTAYFKYRAADLRLHRDGHFPMSRTELENSYLWAQPTFATSAPIFTEVAKSGDLGYVYGRYELADAAAKAAHQATEKGYYVRVWRRDASGNWKLAADITSVVPAK
jgi:ketosteroid isomerase-like protein